MVETDQSLRVGPDGVRTGTESRLSSWRERKEVRLGEEIKVQETDRKQGGVIKGGREGGRRLALAGGCHSETWQHYGPSVPPVFPVDCLDPRAVLRAACPNVPRFHHHGAQQCWAECVEEERGASPSGVLSRSECSAGIPTFALMCHLQPG